MPAWDLAAMPAGWGARRRRDLTSNLIQFATAWTALALFLVAPIST